MVRKHQTRADDFAALCEELAKQTPNKPVDHEHGYEEELEERWRRAQKESGR